MIVCRIEWKRRDWMAYTDSQCRANDVVTAMLNQCAVGDQVTVSLLEIANA